MELQVALPGFSDIPSWDGSDWGNKKNRASEVRRAEMRKERLEYIARFGDMEDKSLITAMQRKGCASARYNVRCLEVDRWQLAENRREYALRSVADNPGSLRGNTDPYIVLRWTMIRQAAGDLALKRPCDKDCWISDDGPTYGTSCTASFHVCSDDAREFLLSIPEWEEDLLGIEPGTIKRMVEVSEG